MKSNKPITLHSRVMWSLAATLFCLFAASIVMSQTTAEKKGRSFATAQEAANALIDAAEKFDQTALTDILGPDSYDIIHTGEPARDRLILRWSRGWRLGLGDFPAGSDIEADARQGDRGLTSTHERRLHLERLTRHDGGHQWPVPYAPAHHRPHGGPDGAGTELGHR